MEAERDVRDSKSMIRLLTALVVMMALLLVGMVGGGLYGFAKYRQAQKTVSQATTSASGKPAKNPDEIMKELDTRRDVLSRELKAQADETQKRLVALDKRRAADSQVEKGAIDKAEQMFRMMQLMSDEMMVMLKHLIGTQEALARSMAQQTPAGPTPPLSGRTPPHEHPKAQH